MKGILALLCAVLLVLGISAATQATQYRIITLSGLLGAPSTTPESINSSGKLVINSRFSDHDTAGTWENGVVTPLQPLLGYTSSWAFGINSIGQVVGYSSTSSQVSEACLWQDGNVIDLGWSGDARDINDIGQVVGRGSNYTRAVLWQNNTLTDLGPGDANAINRYGQVVGRDGSGNAVLWQHGTTTIIGSGFAWEINDSGQIIYATGSSSCLWQNGNSISLGRYVNANSINSSGQVVGYNIGGVWQNGVVTQLPTLPGYTPYEGLYISDSGQVLGWLNNSHGRELSVLWQPVPEPSSLITTVCGLAWLLGVRKRRFDARSPGDLVFGASGFEWSTAERKSRNKSARPLQRHHPPSSLQRFYPRSRPVNNIYLKYHASDGCKSPISRLIIMEVLFHARLPFPLSALCPQLSAFRGGGPPECLIS